MCPFCKHDGKACPVKEQPNGRIMCECGQHSWPNTALDAESVRRTNMTVVGSTHIWTQGM